MKIQWGAATWSYVPEFPKHLRVGSAGNVAGPGNFGMKQAESIGPWTLKEWIGMVTLWFHQTWRAGKWRIYR